MFLTNTCGASVKFSVTMKTALMSSLLDKVVQDSNPICSTTSSGDTTCTYTQPAKSNSLFIFDAAQWN